MAARMVSVPDVSVDGVSGLLVEPDDVDGFARAVETLADDPPRADRLAVAGRESVERQFDRARSRTVGSRPRSCV